MPISTTHSLVGALFGSGVVAVGMSFNFAKLGATFLMPLIVSPLMAAIASFLAYLIFRETRKVLGVTKETCLCVGTEKIPVVKMAHSNKNITVESESSKTIRVLNENECVEIYKGNFIGINSQKMLDFAHFISAGIVSFARGLNDTPKIVGLLIVLNALDIKWGMIAVALAMAIDGLLATTASIHGLPVSTTHVSVGSIFGIGTVTKKAD